MCTLLPNNLLDDADAFRLMANVPGADGGCELCSKEELVDGIDIDILPAITIEAFKFFTCEGGPFDVDAIALSKSNCVSEFDTRALGGALALGFGKAFDFGDGAEHIGISGSANWLIWCMTPSRRKWMPNTSGNFCISISAICRAPTTILRSFEAIMPAMCDDTS